MRVFATLNCLKQQNFASGKRGKKPFHILNYLNKFEDLLYK